MDRDFYDAIGLLPLQAAECTQGRPLANVSNQPRFDLGVLGTCGPLDEQPKALA